MEIKYNAETNFELVRNNQAELRFELVKKNNYVGGEE